MNLIIRKPAIIFVITLLLCSCSNIDQQSDTNNSGGSREETEITETNKIINGFVNEQIAFPLEPEWFLSSVDWLDEYKLIIITGKNVKEIDGNHYYKKTYILDIHDNTKNLIYDGEFLGDAYNTSVVFLDDGNIGICSPTKFLIFSPTSFKLVKESKFKNIEPKAFPDGNRISYRNPDGLFLAQINNQENKMLIDSNNVILGPELSNDKIFYVNILNHNVHLNIYDLINKKNTKYTVVDETNKIDPEIGQLLLSPDHNKVLVKLRLAHGELNSIISILDISNGSIQIIDANFPTIEDLSQNEILYYNIEKNVQLTLLDIYSKDKSIITPEFLQIDSARFSPSQKFIAYIGKLKDSRERMLFIAHN